MIRTKEWITPEEAALKMGVSGSYVRALYHYKTLVGYPLGNGKKARIRISLKSVESFIQKQMNTPSIKERLGTAA